MKQRWDNKASEASDKDGDNKDGGGEDSGGKESIKVSTFIL
jgi:hypothetical protein